jgi:hypothetical protein
LTRRLLVGGALAGGASLLLFGSRRDQGSAQAPAATTRVSVRSLGAKGDGRTDDSRAFQAAQDRLSRGGVIVVESGNYRVNRVDITHRNIQVELAPDAVLQRIGGAGANNRGMFTVLNLVDANFALRGGRIDLNGEGPMQIGRAGRFPNLYGPQTIPTVRAIGGPANAAVFGLRSSHIVVSGVTIENSGENGLLFRNCGDVLVENCRFRNLANYGVEWSLVIPANDQGRGVMPDRSRNHVRGCSFEDLDDYGLGSGNGAGVGGGGGGIGWLSDYSITDCTFLRCQRDLNLEFLAGAGIDGLELARLRSRDARQGGFGLVGVRNAVIRDYQIVNPGYAPTSALGPNWPSIYGGSLSSDFRSVLLDQVEVIDDRTGGISVGTDGQIAGGDRHFRAASAGFSSTDVGTFIGIRNANPQGVCYVGRIVQVVSPGEAVLDLPAARSVRGAQYAYGGACREGLRIFHGTSATLQNCRIEAGVHSGLPGEPPSAAIRVEAVRNPVQISGTTATAPRNARSAPLGLDVSGGSVTGPGGPPGLRVSGFRRNLLQRP